MSKGIGAAAIQQSDARRGKANNLESFTFEWIFQTPEACEDSEEKSFDREEIRRDSVLLGCGKPGGIILRNIIHILVAFNSNIMRWYVLEVNSAGCCVSKVQVFTA